MNSPSSESASQVRESHTTVASLMEVETRTGAETEKRFGEVTDTDNQPRSSKIILLVEDQAFVRNVIAEVLESAGYKLLLAASAAEALEACRMCSEPVDLLLADIVMPGVSGRELATQFKLLRPQAEIVLMSGDSEQLAVLEFASRGDSYIPKPFSACMLLKTVHEVLRMSWQ